MYLKINFAGVVTSCRRVSIESEDDVEVQNGVRADIRFC